MAPRPEQESEPPPRDLTGLLHQAAEGQPDAAEQLLPLVYDHLRAIARQRMAAQNPGHTLQATALVHETYLRLFGGREIAWADRAHFFGAAAEAMRHLLIDHARARGRAKRGGGAQRIPLNLLDLAADPDEDQILALDGAIQRLEAVDGDAAEVVRLRFFAGLSVEQTAEVMKASPSTVKRDWAFARAWLHRALRGDL